MVLRSVTPRWYAHKSAWHELAALVDTDHAGNPPCRPTLSNTSTTSAPQKLNRGSTAGEKRENVSTIVSTRSFRPIVNDENIQSVPVFRFGAAFRRSFQEKALWRNLGGIMTRFAQMHPDAFLRGLESRLRGEPCTRRK
jgi:hypothetical protein